MGILLEKRETEIDLGGSKVTINLVGNADEILMAALAEEETPLWVELWPASIGLARWLWHSCDLKGKKVLELGCGLGLAGIVAALQEGDVLQTDYIPEALKIASSSAELNGLNNIKQIIADWRCFNIEEKFDYIIGADIIYHPELHNDLINIFEGNLSSKGKIIVSDPGRKDGIEFIAKLQSRGWRVLVNKINVKHDNYHYPIDIYILSFNS